MAGTPLAALLPVLANSLAAGRQKQRIEALLAEMDQMLQEHHSKLASLTDQQYKFVNEAFLALMQTTSVDKMNVLKRVVRNSLEVPDMPDQHAVFLGRVIRDISADEAKFLVANFRYERIWLSDTPSAIREKPTLSVRPGTPEGQAALGLLTVGLLMTAEPTYDESGLLKFSPLAAPLIALLRQPED